MLKRVTITGADDTTDPQALVALSAEFPWVEWGILLSKGSEGGPRFPGMAWLRRFQEAAGGKLHTCGHFCGQWVRNLTAGFVPDIGPERAELFRFGRIQLNFHAQKFGHQPFELASALASSQMVAMGSSETIFQVDGKNDELFGRVRDAGPVRAVPLFDLSGGAGELPKEWPTAGAMNGTWLGYAGGLSPDNLLEQLPKIDDASQGHGYWIDVETRVRTEDDQALDMAKVERFLELAAPFVKV